MSEQTQDSIVEAMKDAARYRYLREHCVLRWKSNMGSPDSLSLDFDGSGHDLDAAVDAARGEA